MKHNAFKGISVDISFDITSLVEEAVARGDLAPPSGPFSSTGASIETALMALGEVSDCGSVVGGYVVWQPDGIPSKKAIQGKFDEIVAAVQGLAYVVNSDKTLTIVSGSKTFCVRIVTAGEHYGLNRCLTHEKETPLVEFYDTAHAGKPGFDPLGQFVTRYTRTTMLESKGRGLNLSGGSPDWNLTASSFRLVQKWLVRGPK